MEIQMIIPKILEDRTVELLTRTVGVGKRYYSMLIFEYEVHKLHIGMVQCSNARYDMPSFEGIPGEELQRIFFLNKYIKATEGQEFVDKYNALLEKYKSSGAIFDVALLMREFKLTLQDLIAAQLFSKLCDYITELQAMELAKNIVDTTAQVYDLKLKANSP